MKTIFNFLIYLFAWLLVQLLNLLPAKVNVGIGCCFADIAFLVMSKRRRVSLENINRVYKDELTLKQKKKLAKMSFRHMVISTIELFTVSKVAKSLEEHFEFVNADILQRCLDSEKGAVLAISHLGSWEYLSFLATRTNRSWSVIVKEIKNFHLNQAVNRLRKIMTVEPVPKKNSMKGALRALRKGDGVAILIDQWSGPDGIWAPFFGEETSTTSIPARLVKKTGAALTFAYCIRKGIGKYKIEVLEPIAMDSLASEKSITDQLNRQLESLIRKYPEQWTWGHRRWKAKPHTLRTPV